MKFLLILFMGTVLFGQNCDSFLQKAKRTSAGPTSRIVYSNLYVACIQSEQNRKLTEIIKLLKKKK